VRELRSDINLTRDKCYVAPKFLKNSEKVLQAQKEMNEYLNAQITYQSNSKEVVLGPETFATWIVPTEDMIPSINEQEVRNFVKELSATYNTPNRSGTLVTPKGKSVNMSNACLGSVVNVEGEVTQITSDIKSGKEVTREPLYARKEMANGNFVWGRTYVEVDISEQHLWYIVNGSIRLETPVITGLKGKMDTPTGIFRILEKKRNKTLIGPTVNGKPLYRQPVNYWMRITWSGVGLHDAGWHTVFGGDRYVTSGSHGCINMPPWKAGQLYGMISNGTYVVIHY
jgi:lipoprotein-anchoring transpeptidase ErfK/SrfK